MKYERWMKFVEKVALKKKNCAIESKNSQQAACKKKSTSHICSQPQIILQKCSSLIVFMNPFP